MSNMVEIPWHDGTIRLVEYGTPVLVHYPDEARNVVRFAKDGGYSTQDSSGSSKFDWNDHKVLAVYGKVDAPKIKITVPKNKGALVVDRFGTPAFVRMSSISYWDQWQNLLKDVFVSDFEVSEAIRSGGYKVVFEGVGA